MNLALPFCYYVFGFALSFPAIATQFIFITHLKVPPVTLALCYSLISLPWILKPFYGFISDKYNVVDLGRRRPYIAYSGLLASYMYLHLGQVVTRFYLLVSSLVLISFLICFADVCADSITVEMVKKGENEKTKGIMQSNNWISRATGTVCGSFLGGMAFSVLQADTVYKLTAIFPFLMSLLVWNLPKSDNTYNSIAKKLYTNFKEQRELALILLTMFIAPNYGTFYTYFLTDKLKYTPTMFTWLNMSASLAFLSSVLCYRFFFRKFHIKNTLIVAVLISVIFRLPQLLVVTGTYTEFWLVVCDGVVETYSMQLVVMPLIVYTAQKCNDGVEGSLFALMMSVSNLSNILGDQFGAVVASILGVTETNFENLKYLMIISIIGDLIIPLLAIRRMFFSSSQEYVELDHTPELEMYPRRTSDLLVNTPEKKASMRDSSGCMLEKQGSSGCKLGSSDCMLDSSGCKPQQSGSLLRETDSPALNSIQQAAVAFVSENYDLNRQGVPSMGSDEIEVDLEQE